jgi:hypothetical protein
VDVVSSEIEGCTKAWRKTPPAWEHWGHTAPAQHGHSVQTPEEKIFWANLSDSVKAEIVLVQKQSQCQCKC